LGIPYTYLTVTYNKAVCTIRISRIKLFCYWFVGPRTLYTLATW